MSQSVRRSLEIEISYRTKHVDKQLNANYFLSLTISFLRASEISTKDVRISTFFERFHTNTHTHTLFTTFLVFFISLSLSLCLSSIDVFVSISYSRLLLSTPHTSHTPHAHAPPLWPVEKPSPRGTPEFAERDRIGCLLDVR